LSELKPKSSLGSETSKDSLGHGDPAELSKVYTMLPGGLFFARLLMKRMLLLQDRTVVRKEAPTVVTLE
jgi:hypothetical protein